MIKPLNILIIEDEVIIAKSLERIVTKHANVKLAHDYDTAVDSLTTFNPSLVLLDINLEGCEKTGIDFAQEHKTNHQFEVIFITAYFDEVTFSKANKIKPLNYIVKPFKSSQIDVVIKLITTQLEAKNTSINPIVFNLLTLEERKLINLISLGFSSKIIAMKLNKSPKTIMNQRGSIIKKLNLLPQNNSLLIWSIENRAHLQEL